MSKQASARLRIAPVERRDHSYEARSEIDTGGRTVRSTYPLEHDQVEDYVAHFTGEAIRQGHTVAVDDTTRGRGR